MNKLERFNELKNFDKQYNFQYIAGIDEAGRGPLAGPVVAAAAILPLDCDIVGIDDSKKLSEPKRNILFDEIMKNAVSVGLGMCDEKIIDEINILQATFWAMKRAVDALNITPGCLLIDGNKIIPGNISGDGFPTQISIVKGDSKSLSIAAAGIIAKVTRDRIMKNYGKDYPNYSFAKHKGYPTKAHYEEITRSGTCDIHRKSFLLRWKLKIANGEK
ncbi:MAG: ribonuclease HII [Defluviitaleaceae bacterium]|nr:ribonuclease HII [Defluviitaleaceae bacterium]